MSASFVSRWGRYAVSWAAVGGSPTTAQTATDSEVRREVAKEAAVAAALPEVAAVEAGWNGDHASSGDPPPAVEAAALAQADLQAWMEADDMESPGGFEAHRLPGRGY